MMEEHKEELYELIFFKRPNPQLPIKLNKFILQSLFD